MCSISEHALATNNGSLGTAAANEELITQAQGSMPALRKSLCSDSASSTGVVSGSVTMSIFV